MDTIEAAAPPLESVLHKTSAWRDWLGITASVGCAIHCAAMPFVIAWLPTLGLRFLADESFHQWMVLVCLALAAAAFVPGLRQHGNWIPVSVGAFGLSLITLAAFGLAGECCSACETSSSRTPNQPAIAGVGFESESESESELEFEFESDQRADGTHCIACGDNAPCSSFQDGDPHTMATAELANDKRSDLLSIVAPWITPLGGLILVVAHLLNRRYGCLCGCC